MLYKKSGASLGGVTGSIWHTIKAPDDSVKKKNFRVLRQQIKHKIKRSYQAYLEGLLGLGNNN